MSFINKYSVNCLLGPQAKNIQTVGNIFAWEVNKKKHFCALGDIDLADIDFLKDFGNSSFYYMSPENIANLPFKISKSKSKSAITHINEDFFQFRGQKHRSFRNYKNRYKSFLNKNKPDSLQDLENMLNIWSVSSGEKYFRDFSGKNKFFFKQGFHNYTDNVFIYSNDRLVSFGCASPVENGQATYIIGKSLCIDNKGLSEYTDIALYEMLYEKYGEFDINLGQAKGKLYDYKIKFPNTRIDIHYDGQIKF